MYFILLFTTALGQIYIPLFKSSTKLLEKGNVNPFRYLSDSSLIFSYSVRSN